MQPELEPSTPMAQTASALPSSRRPWVKPILERIPLNEASGGSFVSPVLDALNGSHS
jgi:hypothetical protein